MTRKERYKYRREHGLCVQCGEPLGNATTVRCARCNARNNEIQQSIRNYHRKQGLCPYCGKPLANDGYTICPHCRETSCKTWYEHSNDYAKRTRKYHKKRVRTLKKKGLCIYCGKNPADEGHCGCRECLDKRAKMQREYAKMKAYDAKFFLPVKKAV